MTVSLVSKVNLTFGLAVYFLFCIDSERLSTELISEITEINSITLMRHHPVLVESG